MRLFGKRDNDTPVRFNRYFLVNDAVRLEVGGIFHASRVEDVEGDTLWIAEPASHGVPVRLIEGKPVVLVSSIESGMRGYRSRFVGYRPGPPAMLMLEPYESLGRVQRRGFARVLDALPVVFTVISLQVRRCKASGWRPVPATSAVAASTSASSEASAPG